MLSSQCQGTPNGGRLLGLQIGWQAAEFELRSPARCTPQVRLASNRLPDGKAVDCLETEIHSRHIILQTWAVTSAYLTSCCLSVVPHQSDQSDPRHRRPCSSRSKSLHSPLSIPHSGARFEPLEQSNKANPFISSLH